MRKAKKDLKILAAVGGQNLGSTPFSKMALSETHRKGFAESAVAFCKRHRLDGLVLNWNYPGSGGGRPEDKANFVALLKVSLPTYRIPQMFIYPIYSEQEMKEAFSKPNLLVGVDLSVARETMANGYNLPEISK